MMLPFLSSVKAPPALWISVVSTSEFMNLEWSGGNADYGMDFQQKEQIHDGGVSMLQSQHFSVSAL